MSAPATANDFLRLARQSGLIEPDRYPDPAGLPADPRGCADALVKTGLLTRFQSDQLLTGRNRGFVLGQYKILAQLGRGGMGAVFLAEHTKLGRRAAIKVLPPDKADDRLAVVQFQREARAAAALDHPNIVRLFDVSEHGGTSFLILEYVDGTDLQSLVAANGPLAVETAVGYIAQAAAGLRHAHERGFIHRDIKPANLILRPDGTVKILDMGLARATADDRESATAVYGFGEIAGTIDYLSPEQAANGRLDCRSDIYSLGATFYTLVAGRTPFTGNTAQKILQHQTKDPPPLDRVTGGRLPAALARVVAKMLAKNPDERYASADEVLAALAAWTGGADAEPIRRSPVAPRRTRRRLAAAAFSLLLLAAAGVAALRPGPPPAPPPEPVVVTEVRVLHGHGARVNDLVLSPDGSRLASIDPGGEDAGAVCGWDVRTGRRLFTTAMPEGSRSWVLAGSPDGAALFAGGEGMPILVLDAATGAVVREYAPPHPTVLSLAASPAGRHLLVGGTDPETVLLDRETGQEVRRFDAEGWMVWAAVFSPDGARIATAAGRGSDDLDLYVVKVFDAADGRELHRFGGNRRDVRWLAFRPDGRRLASAGFDGTVREWDLETGDAVRVIDAHVGYAERVAYLPDGRLLSVGSPPWNRAGVDPGGAVTVWDAADAPSGWSGPEWTGVLSLAVAADGGFAAVGSRDRTIRLVPLPR